MSRRRRILLSAGLLAAAVGVALGVLALLPPRPGVTKANFDRIEVSMPEDRVLEIFGEPLRVEKTGTRNWTSEKWIGHDGACATVDIQNHSIIGTEWTPSTETIPGKLRRWLHLPE
jgi:hypothetical protein